MTNLDLDEIERLAKAATPGPWKPHDIKRLAWELNNPILQYCVMLYETGEYSWAESMQIAAVELAKAMAQQNAELVRLASLAPAVTPTSTAALNEAMNDEKLNPWKRVLVDVNVTYWSYKKEHDNDPRAALNDLLAANAHYAADPQVSEIAAKHVNEAIAREIECLRERCAVAKNPLEILDTRANELRGK